ncbi:glutathione S-transferase family protein [Pseudosulfitobacter koreensis]|uniref:Glutathione S-transferase family protein n=1 Tax=Pseudosulfitobacter koreensis TaxID=2968472 RepID=A0ABT1YYI0_9RHOB|nr:glutathione S-transferase family protein [Pseudosulfitobacter koreense]MCR8825937.1 glutathione S-transferase family protein [Pseudosulfitobacter koreense]
MPARMTYVLHYAPDNASLIVRLALDHAGLPFETRLVDRAARAQTSDGYRALNPNGLIPTLETPQGALFETGAILLWLADTHGGLGPAPDHPHRGNWLKWLFFTANTLHPALRMMFYPEKYTGEDRRDQARLRRLLQGQITTNLRTLDAAAADWHFPAPTGLDFYIAGCLRWCAVYPADTDRRWFDLSAYRTLHQMCLRIETLPACATLQCAEGLGDTPFTAPRAPTPPQGSAT